MSGGVGGRSSLPIRRDGVRASVPDQREGEAGRREREGEDDHPNAPAPAPRRRTVVSLVLFGLDGIAPRVFGLGSGAGHRGRGAGRLARAIQRRPATRASGTLGLTGPVAPQAKPLVHGMQGRESER